MLDLRIGDYRALRTSLSLSQSTTMSINIPPVGRIRGVVDGLRPGTSLLLQRLPDGPAKAFEHRDGQFEVSGLPFGDYRVLVASLESEPVVSREYPVELSSPEAQLVATYEP
jgi:hypothetical protein